MTSAVEAADNAAYCAELVRRVDFERYAATLFLAPEPRREVLALQALDIELSSIRDHVRQPMAGEIRLQWWRDVVRSEARGDVAGSPVAAELLRVIAQRPDLADQIVKAIDAHEHDLYDDPHPDLGALEHQLLHSFALPFLLASEAPAELLRAASLAAGLIAVIERIPLHASRQQLLLPLELLRQYDVQPESLFAGETPSGLGTVVQIVAARLDEQLKAALALLPQMPGESRRLFLGLSLIPAKSRAVTQADYQPMMPVRRSHIATLWTLWRASRRKPFAG